MKTARAIATGLPLGRQPSTSAQDALARPPLGASHVGVPDFVAPSLRNWISDALDTSRNYQIGHGGPHLADEVGLRLQMQPVRDPSLGGYHYALVGAPQQDLLLIIDTMLEVWANPWGLPTSELASILDSANMAYEYDRRTRRLVRRQDAAEHANTDQAIHDADEDTADLLRRAREAMTRLIPDPDSAYFNAVRAVESAAWAAICPTSSRPNLGTVWSALTQDFKAATPKWQLRFVDANDVPRDVEALAAMVGLLKDGHRSRHPGPGWRNQTLEEALVAVSLATTLVTIFSTGGVHPRTAP